MAIDRRHMLRGAAALATLPMLPAGETAREREMFAASLREKNGAYGAAIFSPAKGIVSKVMLPGRGHSLAARPGAQECVAFARRPGNFAIAFGPGRKPHGFTARAGRHFYGHGVFSPDGRLLYTTENDFDGARGVIGVRDVAGGYRQIGEFDAGGVGPHDLALLDGGAVLVVANGGIETHPDHGRAKLNLQTMRPNLAYLDTATGDLIERHALPRHLHQLSIRHMTVAAGGQMVFGGQHKGARNEQPTLVGFHRRGGELQLAEIPAAVNAGLKNYVASLAADRSGEIVAATSPKGGVTLYFDARSRRYLGTTRLEDVSGVAALPSSPGFLLTSGAGDIAEAKPGTVKVVGKEGFLFDNHLVRLQTAMTSPS